MSLMTWGPALMIGFGDIDVQHRRLVQLVNALDDAMHAGRSREVLGTVLTELVRYTKLHFAFEEKLMAAYGLQGGDVAAHKEEHATLTAQVNDFAAQFAEGSADVSVELLEFLRDWLSNHILGTDKGLAAALRQAGAVSAA